MWALSSYQCSQIADSQEIFNQLKYMAEVNLRQNQTERNRVKLININAFLSKPGSVVIQPFFIYNVDEKHYSIGGGEIFIGSKLYKSYYDLINDIPEEHNKDQIDLLILEKLISSCQGIPGVLKFNVGPQFLINVFGKKEKVERFCKLLLTYNLDSANIRLELTEGAYEETNILLENVCKEFAKHKISFAIDDFGSQSSSHHLMLSLGTMIKEIKIVPMCFEFNPDEKNVKSKDNLSFIQYCVKLASHRDATITAEAVTNYKTVEFLLENKVFHFQTNLFFGKVPLTDYKNMYQNMKPIPEETVKKLLSDPKAQRKQKVIQNIYALHELLN